MSSQDHRALREQLGAYTLGQLSGAELGAVQAHLQACAPCRAEVAELAPVAATLRQADPDWVDDPPLTAPPPLSSTVVREVRSGRGRRTRTRTGLAGRTVLPRRSLLLSAAAGVAALAAAGGIGYRLGAGAVAPPAGELVAVRTLTPQVRANARLVAHTWGMEVKLTATGFAPGEPYQVSVTDRTGRTVSAGQFLGTGDTEMRCNLNSSVLRTDAASFQIHEPTGDLVLIATL